MHSSAPSTEDNIGSGTLCCHMMNVNCLFGFNAFDVVIDHLESDQYHYLI